MRVAFRNFLKDENRLFDNNTMGIAMFNAHVFSLISKVTILFLCFLAIASLIGGYGATYVVFTLASIACNAMFVLIFHWLKQGKGLRFVIPLCYLDSILFYGAVMFTSLHKTGCLHAGVAFPCFELLFPILILDRTWRINVVALLAFFIHMILSYRVKPAIIFFNDAVNTTVFCFIGLVVGCYFRFTQLVNIDNDRDLVRQRDTDVLTGLLNRRVLFEDLELLCLNTHQLIDAIMVDIDYFKKYNDQYGHLHGDRCLGILGDCFKRFGDKHHLLFCRYGGEEFTAIGMHYDIDELTALAEELRRDVENLNIAFEGYEPGHITISLGCACCYMGEKTSEESIIKLADEALYEAKKAGRNCVKF